MENNKIIQHCTYIVYCTTNIETSMIYVGVHEIDPEKPEDKYIGCGVYSTQPSTYMYPKTKFQYAVKKYGPSKFIRKTLATFNNDEDAYVLESTIVNEKFLARHDVYNMVLGGRNAKAITKTTYQYDKNGNFINSYKSLKVAARYVSRSICTIQRAIYYKIPGAGYFWSFKKFDKLDISQYKINNVSRGFPVYQYSENGEYECCYESIRSCARVIGASDTNLNLCIKCGTKCKNKYYSTEFAENFSIAKSEKIKNTTVYQYDLNGNFIKEWESANKARKHLGFTSDIYKAIKFGRTAGGYQWSLEKLPCMEPEKPKSGKARSVAKYDAGGNLLKVYKTIQECKNENGSGIIHVLNGRDKTHKGFIYKFV